MWYWDFDTKNYNNHNKKGEIKHREADVLESGVYSISTLKKSITFFFIMKNIIISFH